jgi:hypothetical protein
MHKEEATLRGEIDDKGRISICASCVIFLAMVFLRSALYHLLSIS